MAFSKIATLALLSLAVTRAFVVRITPDFHTLQPRSTGWMPRASTKLYVSDDDLDSTADEEGVFLAEEFSKFAKAEGFELDQEDLVEEDEEDDEKPLMEESEDDDDEEINIPQGAISAFLGYDKNMTGNVTTLTNDDIYSEVRERVLDTAGGFAKLVGDLDEDEDEDEEEKEYVPPTTVPDSGLTAGEVVETLLLALRNNDVPTQDRGLEILFDYSSPTSQIKSEAGLTPKEYGEFLKETEYKVLFDHSGVTVDKGDYSFDGKKAFFTARLRVGPGALDVVSVNFILSTTGHEEEDCWLVDSMLIRPQSMRRRRRR